MNRRNFLKSIATVCGAAVVCPGELLKSPVKHLWMRGKGENYIEGESYSGGRLIHRDVLIANGRSKLMEWTYLSIPVHYQENLSA